MLYVWISIQGRQIRFREESKQSCSCSLMHNSQWLVPWRQLNSPWQRGREGLLSTYYCSLPTIQPSKRRLLLSTNDNVGEPGAYANQNKPGQVLPIPDSRSIQTNLTHRNRDRQTGSEGTKFHLCTRASPRDLSLQHPQLTLMSRSKKDSKYK